MPTTENWSNLLISSSQESLNNERLCGLFFTSLLKRDAICYYLCLAVGNQYRTCQILDTSKIVYSALSIEIDSFIFLDNILRNAKLILFNPVLFIYGEIYGCPHPFKEEFVIKAYAVQYI